MSNNEQALIDAISSERLQKYLEVSGGDINKALELYKKNAELASSFYPLLQAFEITLRNAMHRQLCHKFGENWFKTAPLDSKELRAIDEAIRNQVDRLYTTGHVIADLNLAFWVGLLSKRYHRTLWFQALHKCVRTPMPHAELHKRCEDIRILRNRIAHYEPIFMRDCQRDKGRILEVIGWLEPDMAEWLV